MELNDKQYEWIGRRLDGEDIELTAAEQAAAEDILAAQAELAKRLDALTPPQALQHARRRLAGELARPRHNSLLRLAAYAASAAVAAAVIVIAVTVHRNPMRMSNSIPIAVSNTSVIDNPDELADQLDRIEDVLVNGDELNFSIDDLERYLDEFWSFDNSEVISES